MTTSDGAGEGSDLLTVPADYARTDPAGPAFARGPWRPSGHGYAAAVPRRPVVLSLLACSVLGLAGCSDGGVKQANAYVGAVNAAQGRFAATSERLLADIVPDDVPVENGAALSRFYGAVDGFADELRAIQPPAAVRTLHDRLISAIVRFGGELRRAGRGITSGSASRILTGQERLAAATAAVGKRINATIAAINTALQR